MTIDVLVSHGGECTHAGWCIRVTHSGGVLVVVGVLVILAGVLVILGLLVTVIEVGVLILDGVFLAVAYSWCWICR